VRREVRVKTGELAGRLYVSPSLIRKWAQQYEDFLSVIGGGVAPGAVREFNEDDQIVLASVAHLRNEGRSHDEIRQVLAEGWRVEEVPDPPSRLVQETARETGALTVGQAKALVERVRFLEDRVAQLEEQDAARVQELRRMERELGRAEGALKELRNQNGRPRWPWQRGEQ